MHTARATAGTVVLVATLAACNGGSGHSDSRPTEKPSMTTAAPSTHLAFGGSYAWPDGLKVSVVSARVFTDYNRDGGESPQPGFTDFRVTLRLTNGGKSPVDLSQLSTIVQGATNGGEAEAATFENGSEPLSDGGQLAPGVTTVKTDDESLATKYGRRIVVRVQRVAAGFGQDFPEFTGTITG